jgi:predicted alpha/beta superfamily hydrolase
MKQSIFLLLLLSFYSCKKDEFIKSPELKKKISITSIEKGKTYEISIFLPDNYTSSKDYYPTMYVLDADQDQEFVADQCRKASKMFNAQNVIVVGIGYGDNRNIDYTPTPTSYGQGGSETFMNFIKKELIPRIQQDFRADSSRKNRVIIGHSFGGLFGAYAFTKHNEVFGNYLLLSSSLFYDNSVILQYEQQSRPNINQHQQLVFIGAGSTESSLLPANDLLYQRLVNFYPNTKSIFSLVPGKGHNTSRNTDIENAISFYFKNR